LVSSDRFFQTVHKNFGGLCRNKDVVKRFQKTMNDQTSALTCGGLGVHSFLERASSRLYQSRQKRLNSREQLQYLKRNMFKYVCLELVLHGNRLDKQTFFLESQKLDLCRE